MKPRALVLFDIDGTLLSRAGAHHKLALIAGIRQVTGIETHLDGVATSGMLDRDLITHMLQAAGFPASRIRRAMRKIVEACQQAYLANCSTDLTSAICPGVIATLTELRSSDAALGLVTGNLSAIGWKKIELARLRDYFAIGAFAEDAHTRARLARVAFLRAKKTGFVQANARVTLIGDHMNDVAAARANGFQSIAVASGLTTAEQLAESGPDILLESLNELDVTRLL